MKLISGFTISILLLMGPLPAKSESADTADIKGLRIGFNLSRPLFRLAEPSRIGFESVADFNLGDRYFAVAEAGYSKREFIEPTYSLRESGLFFRFGADNNFYNEFDDVIALGLRLGFSYYTRQAPGIYVEPGYWGHYSGSLASETFFRQWAEVVIVLKAEVFTNIFMGWNIRGKLLLSDKDDMHIGNRYIPGFGPGEMNSILGFDFYVYYRIPLKI